MLETDIILILILSSRRGGQDSQLSTRLDPDRLYSISNS